jgi:translocation and assembly module TamB
MPENVIVRGRNLRVGPGAAGLGDLNATVGGTLHLDKALGQPTTVLGTVDIVRGSYSFQGRRFDISRGSEVRFRGLTPIDPALNLTAERDITGVTAQVRVVGTLSRPELTLTSNPPLDEGDVLSLIMFNRSVNRLGDAEKVSLAETAGALAAGSITSPITASVARALDLDIFDITPTDVSGGGATVTVGRQVSERLFVGFKQAFGADETSRLTFEYQLTQFLRIISSVGQGVTTSQLKSRAEAAGIDLIFIIK